MNFAALFIRRPIMTTLVMVGILFFGTVAYRFLPVSDLPNVDFPTILVSASLPGASPETMAAAVATPLERQFSTIAGVDSMSSSSAQGLTQITLQFALNRNIDAAALDVQAMISKAAAQLPRDLPNPPTFQKVNPADQPVLFLAISSPTLPLSTVNEYADTYIAQRISMISGVAQVQLYGAQKFAVRAQLDPQALASRGLGIDEVVGAIQKGNVDLPTGVLHGRHQAYTLEANGQLFNAADFQPLIVAYRHGAPVRLQDLGQVRDSVENDKIASWYNGTRAIILAVQRQPGANTVQVVDDVKKLIRNLRSQIPASVELNTLYDRSLSIRASVEDVQFTLILAVVLVVLVIFFFLRNLSATVIPSLALPLSIVGTFAVMHFLGFSVNNFSLLALTLCVGFIVDDAIVMLENIVRHMEQGKSPMQAALDGSREIGFTILSMTLSLVAVFIPVLFMGGLIGRLLHEFALTISAAILISGFISLSLTPMLCSRFLRPHHQKHGRLYGTIEALFESTRRLYERTLRWSLRHRAAIFVLSFLLLGATGWLFVRMPKGFLPSDDISQIFTFTEASQSISFQAMAEHQQALAEIVRQNPNVEGFMSSIGPSGPNSTGNSGRIFMRLKPRAERRQGVDEIIQELRQKFAQVPGIRAFPQNMPAIRIGGRLTKSLYQVTLQGPDTEELYRQTPILEDKIRQLPGLVDVTSDLQIKSPQVRIQVDRDKASALGVTPQQIEDALYSAYGARQVSTINTPNNQYRVIVELLPEYQANPTDLPRLYVRSSRGPLVPLDAVASLHRDVGPLTINHSGQLPAVTISFNLKPGVALGDAVDLIQEAARQALPPTITLSFQGTAQAFQSSMQGLGLLLLLAVFVIYLVLGILYESFLHPITILSGLPSAAFGALVTLVLFGQELNLYGFVGVILLIGIVKKNAIMVIDFALEAQRREGKSPEEAVFQGSLVRFRPIMMTTFAALMGTLPVALSLGGGAESRRSLGLAVVGGLVVSQLLTLYLTPVVYLYLDKLTHAFRPKPNSPPTPPKNNGSCA